MPKQDGPNWLRVYAGLPPEWRALIVEDANALIRGIKAQHPDRQFSRGSAIEAVTALLWKSVMSSE